VGLRGPDRNLQHGRHLLGGGEEEKPCDRNW
jgi:hypothetical protein